MVIKLTVSFVPYTIWIETYHSPKIAQIVHFGFLYIIIIYFPLLLIKSTNLIHLSLSGFHLLY